MVLEGLWAQALTESPDADGAAPRDQRHRPQLLPLVLDNLHRAPRMRATGEAVPLGCCR